MIHCKYDQLLSLKQLDLIKNPKNPNKHTTDQITRLAKLYEYHGIRHPIIISERTGLIVAGHGRLQAAHKLGLKEFPVEHQNFESDEAEYAFMCADNAIAEWAELDLSLINLEVPSLGPDFDMEWLGLKDFKIDVSEKGLTDEDEVPEVSEAFVKRGEIWQLGEHRLMCGDSTSKEDVELLMNGEKADMVFTDPPYGIKNDSAKGATYNNNKAYDDSETFDLNKLPPFDSDFVIWGGNYYESLPLPRNVIGWVVWDKRPTRDHWDQNTRDAADRIFGQHFEIAVTNIKGSKGKMIRKTWGGFYGTAGNKEDEIVHRTQKPVELLTHFINDDHKIIMDLFGGSGSTLIACQKTNRKCFMMEIDKHYCGVIIERWQKFTGQTALLQRET